MKVKINMIGGGFQHDVCSSALNTPKYIEWVKDGSANISIHIDYAIFQPVDKTKKNYGWVAESSSIIPQVVDGVKKNLQTLKENYEMIFTHDRRIVNLDPSFFKFTLPNACPWIQNKKIYEKNKNISFIVSNKTITEGHRYRLQVLEKYKNYVDHFGMGFTKNLPWSYQENGSEESGKLLALKDYRFSFAFENDNYDSIFCEKITDCFVTGTIPIYVGNPNIGDFFDSNGIIMYDDSFEIENLTEEFYKSKLESINNNFQAAIDLPTSEDYFYTNYIR